MWPRLHRSSLFRGKKKKGERERERERKRERKRQDGTKQSGAKAKAYCSHKSKRKNKNGQKIFSAQQYTEDVLRYKHSIELNRRGNLADFRFQHVKMAQLLAETDRQTDR